MVKVTQTFFTVYKVYATLTMRNTFLGVQISIIWVVFTVKTVTLLWQPALKSSGYCKRVSLEAIAVEIVPKDLS